MNNTREIILQSLLQKPRSTIQELAEMAGINAISVRHHLINLQLQGLIIAEEERHGVGRPRMVYLLSESGVEHFPTRYMRLTNRLLDQLKGTLPESLIKNLFTQMGTDMAAEYASEVENLTMEERLDLVKNLLASEGFTVDWEKVDNHYQINEITCPYFHIGQSHPEVCSVDQVLISKMLTIPVEKIQCVLQGDNLCTYRISQEIKTETST